MFGKNGESWSMLVDCLGPFCPSSGGRLLGFEKLKHREEVVFDGNGQEEGQARAVLVGHSSGSR